MDVQAAREEGDSGKKRGEGGFTTGWLQSRGGDSGQYDADRMDQMVVGRRPPLIEGLSGFLDSLWFIKR